MYFWFFTDLKVYLRQLTHAHYFSYSIYLNINSHNSQKKITSDRVILIKLRASNCSNIVFLLYIVYSVSQIRKVIDRITREKNMFAERHVQKVGWKLAQFWFRNTNKKSADLRQIVLHQNQLIFVGLALCSRNFQNGKLRLVIWIFFKFTATQILREIKFWWIQTVQYC